jgi:hypothetical protein
MIHLELAALEKWEPIEYAAGYRARLAEIPDSEIAHHCWRCGWEDADTEALELDRHKRVLADGSEGRAGSAEALTDGNDRRCLYAGDSRERTGNGQFHQSGVAEVGG